MIHHIQSVFKQLGLIVTQVEDSEDARLETKTKKCGVYGFIDLELPGDYYNQMVYNLYHENKALNRRIDGSMEDSRNTSGNSLEGTSNRIGGGIEDLNNKIIKDLKDDLTLVKSKLKVYDRFFIVVTVCLFFLCFVTLFDLLI